MATLLNAVTVDTVGSAADLSKPCTVHCKAVLAVGAGVAIQTKTTNTAWKTVHSFAGNGSVNVDINGDYQIRAKCRLRGGAGPVTVETTEAA